MNKEELKAMVAELLGQMEPQVKGGDYRPTAPQPEQKEGCSQAFVPDVTQIDLRKLYLTENPENGQEFRKLKSRTPARLGCGKAGARYKTLTMLRFRADHAAAQDAVFSQVPEDFPEKNGMIAIQTCCEDKEQYLTRPDLGRILSEKTAAALKAAIPTAPRVQIVVGDGLSSAAITANAVDCMKALQAGLRSKGIETGKPIFVRYCRVGAGDAISDVIGCEVVCMLVGERPGLVTDKSMSAYITYKAHRGIPESARTVISNIHDQGTPAVEAGAFAADLIETILQRRTSGVALQSEAGA
ncbi:MAG: ethanolamine ammonia-lyase subunit EutC [Firmicutes bacterium]|nr:ethanolamine ammonia-lyase subunit EutC [Bacillota bacterium]